MPRKGPKGRKSGKIVKQPVSPWLPNRKEAKGPVFTEKDSARPAEETAPGGQGPEGGIPGGTDREIPRARDNDRTLEDSPLQTMAMGLVPTAEEWIVALESQGQARAYEREETMRAGGVISRQEPKLDGVAQALVVKMIRVGTSPTLACRAAGIPAPVFREWMRVGRTDADRGQYETMRAQFFLAVEEAAACGEIFLLERIRAASADPKQWKAAAWLLEMNNRKKYGKRLAISAAMPSDFNVEMETPELPAGERAEDGDGLDGLEEIEAMVPKDFEAVLMRDPATGEIEQAPAAATGPVEATKPGAGTNTPPAGPTVPYGPVARKQ